LLDALTVDEEVDCAIARQMSALQQDWRSQFSSECSASCPHFFKGTDRLAEEHRCFGQVRSNQVRALKKAGSGKFDCNWLQENVAGCGDHHRVDDQRNARCQLLEKVCNNGDVFSQKEQSGFDCAYGETGETKFDLPGEVSAIDFINSGNGAGNFRDHAGDGG